MTGQEINEAVARKLGWESYAGKKFWKRGEEIIEDVDLPNYCHSIAAAWEIVEFVHADETNSFHLYWHATEKVTCGIQEYLGMNPR